jgi:membrane-bound lytic murein transglycosylase A
MKIQKSLKSFVIILFFLFLLLQVSGCGPVKKAPVTTAESPLVRVSPRDLPLFEDDIFYDSLVYAMDKSLAYLHRLPLDRQFAFGDDIYDTAHMIRSFEEFIGFLETKPSPEAMGRHIASNYRVYRSVGGEKSGRVLFTGYYEPFLEGSRRPGDRYPFPLYGLPSDMLKIDLSPFSSKFKGQKITGRFDGRTVVPYHDRHEIDDQQALDGKVDILVWVKDPVDLFFLHIQGSGKVFLEGGGSINVHYMGSNGRPYRSVGSLLIEEGKISREEMSMQKIRAYLEQNPGEMTRIFNYNPSYVFFQEEKDGPLGCLSVKLTPGRSIATDRRIFPSAALAYAVSEKPLVSGDGRILDWIPFGRFVLNQDTGGAIKGPGRADLFWGNGAYAELAAGHMKHPGKLFFMVLKPQ